jgi:hypothetical protein
MNNDEELNFVQDNKQSLILKNKQETRNSFLSICYFSFYFSSFSL